VADGIVVQQTRDSDDPQVAGGLQSLCWGSASIGGLLSAYFSGSLLTIMTPRHVFGVTAILPFLVTLIAFSIDEPPTDETTDTNVARQAQDLWAAIRQPSIWKPALFLFLWQSTPTSDGAFLYFMTNDLGMGPEFLGRVRLVTAAASLLGVWVYQKFLRTVSIKNILLWSSIISTPLGLSSLLLISHTNRALGIPDGAFVFGDDVALAILGQVAFLPTLVLAAKLCPPGVEAVLFATLMSIFNGASTVGTEVGAALTKVMGVTEDNFDNLGMLTIICNLSSLYPLIFIGWLDGVGDVSEEDLGDM
jgi:folate/biopterin transporter